MMLTMNYTLKNCKICVANWLKKEVTSFSIIVFSYQYFKFIDLLENWNLMHFLDMHKIPVT